MLTVFTFIFLECSQPMESTDYSNILLNESFEMDQTPSLEGWRFGNPQLAQLVNEAPPGGGNWSLQLTADWAPSLAILNEDNTIRVSHPFDRDGIIDNLEREALIYFSHLEKYPQFTKDVARLMISEMHEKQGNYATAIRELESLIKESPNLSKINHIDREAANDPDGYLIQSEPPNNALPIWRTSYGAYIALINLYATQNMYDKAISLGISLVSSISPDGWYWNVNKYVGSILLKNGDNTRAIEQFELARNGLQKQSLNMSKRLENLNNNQLVVKPESFISWDDQARQYFINDITNIENLLQEARSQ